MAPSLSSMASVRKLTRTVAGRSVESDFSISSGAFVAGSLKPAASVTPKIVPFSSIGVKPGKAGEVMKGREMSPSRTSTRMTAEVSSVCEGCGWGRCG